MNVYDKKDIYPWDVLEIEPTENKKIIKRAYAKLVKTHHPEDDPTGFIEIQKAYKYALNLVEKLVDENKFNNLNLDEIVSDKVNKKEITALFDKESNSINYTSNVEVDKESKIEAKHNLYSSLNEMFENRSINTKSNINYDNFKDINNEEKEKNSSKLDDIYYNKFKYVIDNSLNYRSLYTLFMEYNIISLLNTNEFYSRIAKDIILRIDDMDIVSLKFLSDYFKNIRYSLNNKIKDELDLTRKIDKNINDRILAVNRKKVVRKYIKIGLIVVVVLMTGIFAKIGQDDRNAKEQVKQEIIDEKTKIENKVYAYVPIETKDDSKIKKAYKNNVKYIGAGFLTFKNNDMYKLTTTRYVAIAKYIPIKKGDDVYLLNILDLSQNGPYINVAAYYDPKADIAHYYVISNGINSAVFDENLNQLSEYKYEKGYADARNSFESYLMKDNDDFIFYDYSSEFTNKYVQ